VPIDGHRWFVTWVALEHRKGELNTRVWGADDPADASGLT
jgi:hypothetical protein